jgi:hypothetical protein
VTAPQPADDNLALARRVEQLCTGFEAAWQAGTPPLLEDFLPSVGGADQAGLKRDWSYFRLKLALSPFMLPFMLRSVQVLTHSPHWSVNQSFATMPWNAWHLPPR